MSHGCSNDCITLSEAQRYMSIGNMAVATLSLDCYHSIYAATTRNVQLGLPNF